MTPECLNALYLEYLQDGSSEAQFTLAPDPTAGLKRQECSEASPESRRGPRGGKKPLRPRQQQLSALEAELERKQKELRAAQEERDRLQQRIKVLEVVLPIREEQVQWLTQRRKVAHGIHAARAFADGAVPQPHALRITELQASGSSGGIASGPEAEHASEESLEFGTGSSATAAAAACQCPPARRRAIQSTDYAEVYISGKIAPFTSIPGHSSVPRQVLRHFCDIWKTWVREAGLVLHSYDARPHDPGPQVKLAQLYEQLIAVCHPLQIEHPSFFAELMNINLETGEHGDLPPDSFWVPVAQGLRYSPDQVADARAALALYKERVATCMEERRRLVAQLSEHLAVLQGRSHLHQHPHQHQQQVPLGGFAGQPPAGPFTCGLLLLELDRVMAALYRNVMAQGDALEIAKDFMGGKQFSLVQMVRASVLSYPYFPDVIAVLASLDAISPRVAVPS